MKIIEQSYFEMDFEKRASTISSRWICDIIAAMTSRLRGLMPI